MAAKRSLTDMMAKQLEKPASRAKIPAKPAEVAESPAPAPAGPAPKAKAEGVEKVTLYLPSAVYRFVKLTAVEMDKRPHDLLMEGVELMLAQHGKSLKDFR